MVIKKKLVRRILLCISCWYLIVPVISLSEVQKEYTNKKRCYDPTAFVGEIIVDAFDVLKNLFSVSTAKVITAVTPLYIASRVHDEKIQNCFYDPNNHKNIRQFPKACHHLAHYGVGVPMVALSSLAIFAHDENIRLTALMFAIGLPFVHSGKDIIKKLRFKACLRPWHEDFDRHRRSSGGFPSGHMANVVYMASLFGMRLGPAWGVPLSLFAGFVFADFLNCNRHYFSQMVAGAGLGLMFACAASKVVDRKLSERCSFSCGIDSCGVPSAQICYRF